MRIKLIFLWLILMVVAAATPAWAQSQQDLLGNFEGERYSNRVLKFEIDIPRGWLIAETEERKAITKVGSEAIKTGNREADRLLAESEKRDVVLVFVTEKPLGSINNGAFGMSVTRLPAKGYTPKFLTETFKSTMLANPKNRLVKDVSVVTIAGRSWGNVLIDLDMFGQTVHTNYFVTLIGDYALVATMSYQDEKHFKVMDTAFRAIRFTPK